MRMPQAARLSGLMLAAFLLLGPTPATYWCPDRLAAADEMLSHLPDGCTSPSEAEKSCKKWVKICKKRAKSAIQCQLNALKIHKSVEKTLCSQESEADPKGCKQGVADEKKTETRRLKDKGFKSDLLDVCEGRLLHCMTNC